MSVYNKYQETELHRCYCESVEQLKETEGYLLDSREELFSLDPGNHDAQTIVDRTLLLEKQA